MEKEAIRLQPEDHISAVITLVCDHCDEPYRAVRVKVVDEIEDADPSVCFSDALDVTWDAFRTWLLLAAQASSALFESMAARCSRHF